MKRFSSCRKLRLAIDLTVATMLLICLQLAKPAAAETRPQPNVLFIAVDDMKDWVHCLGGYEGQVHTPNIDRLAKRGILFTNAHCASPKCAPSRAAMLTGLRPSTTGLYDNGHWWLPNRPDAVTLPAQFRRHGYRVVGAGKIFHHTAGNHPPNQWDDYLRLTFREDPWFRGNKLNYPWSQHEPYPVGFPFSNVRGLGHENDWGSLPIADDRYDDERTLQYAVNFLNQQARTTAAPFFLACGFFRPHLPWYVPQQFFDLYPTDEIALPQVLENDRDDLPPEGLQFARARQKDFEVIRDARKWKYAVRAYLASISCVDDRIGRVLDALDASDQADSTIIVLWSDHGWHLGEKHHWHKSTLWEEATRVPLIIAAPGYQPGVCNRPVSLLDVYPTLNELARFKETPKLDGLSLEPLMKNPKAERDRPAIIEYKPGNVAIRDQRFRYIRYRDGGEELYDLVADPNEWHNIAHNDRFADAKLRLAKWVPQQWAAAALTKKAFQFDAAAFTWTHKETGKVTYGKEP